MMLNQTKKYNLDIVDCWFYWFAMENDFGKKNLEISFKDDLKEKNFLIKDFDSFYKYILLNKKLYELKD